MNLLITHRSVQSTIHRWFNSTVERSVANCLFQWSIGHTMYRPIGISQANEELGQRGRPSLDDAHSTSRHGTHGSYCCCCCHSAIYVVNPLNGGDKSQLTTINGENDNCFSFKSLFVAITLSQTTWQIYIEMLRISKCRQFSSKCSYLRSG